MHSSSKPLDILVIGGGMYTIGNTKNNYGTIMPALLEGRLKKLIGRIGLVTTNDQSAARACERVLSLASLQKTDGQCEPYPKCGVDHKAYQKAALDFNPDVAIIAVPDELHAEIAIDLIRRGIHCLVVKPMAPDVVSAKAMAQAARDYNVVAEVEFHKRLDESNRLLCDAVKSGQLGDLLYAVIEYSQQKRIPRDVFKGWAGTSNIFQYLGVHYVDLLQFATGYRPVRVTAWGQKSYLVNQGIDTWDAMQVVIEWEKIKSDGRFVSTHITNWIDPDFTSSVSDQKINVVGTQGRFQADQKNRGVQTVTDQAGVEDINPYFTKAITSADGDRIQYQGYGIDSILQFIKDVQRFQKNEIDLVWLDTVRPTFANCVVSTAVIQAAKDSLLNGSIPIEVEDICESLTIN
jgi:predicted dehydrogenase